MLTEMPSSNQRSCADLLKDENQCFKVISIFARNYHISIQAVRLSFNVPCIQNLNQCPSVSAQ